MNITIMNSLSFPGACKSGTATTCRRSKSILKHLSLWLLMLFALSGTAWAQQYYVFESNGYYLSVNSNGNTTTVSTQTGFSPDCVWEYSDSKLSITKGGTTYYLQGGDGSLSITSNSSEASTWTNSSNIFYYRQRRNNNNYYYNYYYIKFSSTSWTCSRKSSYSFSSNEGTAAQGVTRSTDSESATENLNTVSVSIIEGENFIHLGNPSVSLQADISYDNNGNSFIYTPAYTEYRYTIGDATYTHYSQDDGVSYTENPPSSITLTPTYSWSLSGVNANVANLLPNGATSTLTCNLNPSAPQTAVVTCTVTYGENIATDNTTVPISISIQRLAERNVEAITPDSPISVSITPAELYLNQSASLSADVENEVTYTPAYTHYYTSTDPVLNYYQVDENGPLVSGTAPAPVTLSSPSVTWDLNDNTYAQLGATTGTSTNLNFTQLPNSDQTVTAIATATYTGDYSYSATATATATLNSAYVVSTEVSPAATTTPAITLAPETIETTYGASATGLTITAAPVAQSGVNYVRCVLSDGSVWYVYRTSANADPTMHQQNEAPTTYEPFDLVYTPSRAELTLDDNLRTLLRFSPETASSGVIVNNSYNSATISFTNSVIAYAAPATAAPVTGTINAKVVYTANFGGLTVEATDNASVTVVPSINVIHYSNNGTDYYLAVGSDGLVNATTTFGHNCLWNKGANNTVYADYEGTRYYLAVQSGVSLTATTDISAAAAWSMTDGVLIHNGSSVYYNTSYSRFELGSTPYTTVYSVSSESMPAIDHAEVMGLVIDSISSIQAGGCAIHPYRNWVALDGGESHAFQATATATRRLTSVPSCDRYYFTNGTERSFYYRAGVSYSSQSDIATVSSTDRVKLDNVNISGINIEWMLSGDAASHFTLDGANTASVTVGRTGNVAAPATATLKLKMSWTYGGAQQQAFSPELILIAESESSSLTTTSGDAFESDGYYRISNLADDGQFLSVDADNRVVIADGSGDNCLWQISQSEGGYTLTNYATGGQLVWNVNNVSLAANGTLSLVQNADANNKFDIATYTYDDNSYFTLAPAGNGFPYYAVANTGNNVMALVAAKESTSRRSTNSSYHDYLQSGVEMFDNARWQLQMPVLPAPAVVMDAQGYTSFTSAVPGTVIRYSINGQNEQNFSSTFLLAEGDRLEAYCTKAGWYQSPNTEFTAVKVPTPVITDLGGRNFSVTMPWFNGTPSIFYTVSEDLNSSNLVPDTTTAVRYTAPVALNDNYSLAVRAYAPNCLMSDAATHTFTSEGGYALYLFTDGTNYLTNNGPGAFSLNALWYGATDDNAANIYTNQATNGTQTVTIPEGYTRYAVTVAPQPAATATQYSNASLEMLLRSPMQQGLTHDMQGAYAYLNTGDTLTFVARLTVAAAITETPGQTKYTYTYNNHVVEWYAHNGQYAAAPISTITEQNLVNPAGMTANWSLGTFSDSTCTVSRGQLTAASTDFSVSVALAGIDNQTAQGTLIALGSSNATIPAYASIKVKGAASYLGLSDQVVDLGAAGQNYFNGLPALTTQAAYGDDAIWQLIPQGEGAYRLVHVATGLPAVWRHSATDGSQAMYLYNQPVTASAAMAAISAADADAFKFYLTATADGEYTIAPYDVNGEYLAFDSQLGNTIDYWSENNTFANNTFVVAAATVTPPTVAMTPDGTVTITSQMAEQGVFGDATIRYTTSSNALNATSGDIYTAPFGIVPGNRVQAMLTADGAASSVVLFEPATTAEPTITLDGDYLSFTAAEGASIRYTVDGSVPSFTTGILYTDPIYVDPNTNPIVRAVAYTDNQFQSPVAEYVHAQKQLALSISYTNSDGSTPVVTVTPSIVGSPSETPIASYYTIYYTLDGSDPSLETSPRQVYSGPLSGSTTFPANEATLVRAVAVPANGSNIYLASEVKQQTVVYGVTGPLTPTADGTYIIASAADLLRAVATINATAANEPAVTGSYRVTDDIDMTGIPMSSIDDFRGTWDGDYHTISGLTVPLFDTVTGATIRNVRLDNVNITGTTAYVGALVNEALYLGTTGTGTIIYNCGVLATNGSTVSGGTSGTGGLVGHLGSYCRVVNCYNYANVSASSTYVSGVVAYANIAATTSNINGAGSLVFNCMNYGNVTNSGTGSMGYVYAGRNTRNDNATGFNTYNYFRFDANYTGTTKVYNGALGAEERYLKRFEFHRNLLNSNVELSYRFVNRNNTFSTNRATNTGTIGKWVLDTTIAPYPIIKPWGTYPSIINRDHANAAQWDRTPEDRYKGRKMGTLTLNVVVNQDNTGNAASYTTQLTLPITDIDTNTYDYNYYKVQLPYYNSLPNAPANYGAYVVTGWDITNVVDGTQGTFTRSKTDNDGYNFADRYCTAKDLKTVSGRTFAQGGFYNVPEGVTEITITAHWGRAVYLSDATYDEITTSTTPFASTTPIFSSRPEKFNEQTVHNSFYGTGSALSALTNVTSVYDQAIVLVGNYHFYNEGTISNDRGYWSNKPFTLMSVDQDNDNEPDYSAIYYPNKCEAGRTFVDAVRFDFINSIGWGMAAKPQNIHFMPNQEILLPRNHFEITETCIIRFTEFEYDYGNKTASPLILNGGVIEQIVSGQGTPSNTTTYIQLGGNVWFKMFSPGTHGDNTNVVEHVPVSVTGGEYESFYLSGMFRAEPKSSGDDAQLYTNGGKFHFYASAGQEQIDGDVTVKMDNSIVDEFYGGGINAQKPITGDINITINNSLVGQYCGGPQFGDMVEGKVVTTNATGTTFLNSFYGAGYGGTSYVKVNRYNKTCTDLGVSTVWTNDDINVPNNYNPASGRSMHAKYEFEYFSYAGGRQLENVARFHVYNAVLSKANTNDVTSNLTNCLIKGSFYGGGNIGTVIGNVTSTLTNTTVMGNAYGAGFSAAVPTCDVYPEPDVFYSQPADRYPSYDGDAGVYIIPPMTEPVTCDWTYSATETGCSTTDRKIYTNLSLDDFGKVTGNVELNILGNSHVHGSVFGGGDESEVQGETINTNVHDNAVVDNNLFGGGNIATVYGNTTVTVGQEADDRALIRGTVFGGGNAAAIVSNDNDNESDHDNYTATVNFNSGIAGKVFAGGNAGSVYGTAAVNMKGGYVGYTLDAENQVVPYIPALGTPKSFAGVFGGGLGLGTTVTKESRVNIGASTGMIAPINIYGSVYGGGEEGQLGGGYVTAEVADGASVDGMYVADANGDMTAASGTAEAGVQYFTYLNPASHGQYGDISNVTVLSDGTHAVNIAGAVFGGGRGFVVNREGVRLPASNAKSIAGVVYANTNVAIGTVGQDSTWVRIGSLEYFTPIETAQQMGLVPDPNDVSHAHNAYWEPNYFVYDYEKSAYRELTPGDAPQYITAITLDGEPVENFNLSNTTRDASVAYFINTGRVAIAGGGEEGAVKGNFNGSYKDDGLGGNTTVAVHSGIIGDVVYRLIDGQKLGEVGGDVYGGGFGAAIDGVSSVIFDGANAWCRGEVFGGGCMGATNAYKRASADVDIVATQVLFEQGWARRVFAGSNMVDHPAHNNSQVIVGTTPGTDDNTLVSGSVFGGNGYSLSAATTDVQILSGKIGHVRAGNDITVTGSSLNMNYANFVNGVRTPVPVATGIIVPYYNDALIYAGSVYGSGLGPKAHVLKSHVQVKGGEIRNGVFGGGELAGVLEYADENMTVAEGESTTVETFVCKSMTDNGSIVETTTNYIQGNAEARVEISGGKMSAVFGGGRGYSQYLDVKGSQPGAILGNTYVTITGGEVDSTNYPQALGGGNVYGGGLEGVVAHNTYVRINNGVVDGNAFAGGRGFRAAYRGQYCGDEDKSIVQNASIDAGAVYGNANIFVYDSVAHEGVPEIGTGVYGGGEGWIYATGNRMDTVAIVYGNTHVDISAGTIGGGFINGGVSEKGSFAGGRIAPVYGYADIHIHGKANISSVYGGNDIAGYVKGNGRTATVSAYGGTLTSDSTSTYVKVTETPAIGHLFGGGNGAYDYYDDASLAYLNLSKPNQPSTYVDLNMAAYANLDADTRTGYIGQAFAGANNAQVVKAQIFNHSLGLVDTLFGGGNLATVEESVKIWVNANITRDGNTANDDNINYLFGGNNFATMDILPDIYLKKGIIEYVYGGGNQGEMTASQTLTDRFGEAVESVSTHVQVNSTALTIRGALYGGCNMAKVHGTSFVEVFATSTDDDRPNVANLIGHEGNAFGIARIFGGNDISERCELARVDVFGGYIHNIYGGGNGDYTYNADGSVSKGNNLIATEVSGRPYCDSANVNLYSGHILSNVYGGGLAGDCGDTYLLIDDNADNNLESSESNETSENITNAQSAAGNLYITGAVFGGGCGDVLNVGSCASQHPHVGNVLAQEDGSARGTATTDLKSVAELGALKVYGGGNAGDVNSTWLTLHDTWNQSIDYIYGGCRASDVRDSANTVLNRTDLESYTAKYVFGGNDYAGNVTKSNLTVNGGKYISLYGAGNGNYNYSDLDFDCVDVVPNTEYAVTNIYSPAQNVTTFESFVYGGGDMGTVFKGDPTATYADADDYGRIELNIHGGYFGNQIFTGAHGVAGGKQLVYGLKQLNMDGGVVANSIYGGSQNVNDGYPAECTSTTSTTQRPSTIMNIVGGEIGNNIYGGGYFGMIYGSVYVNVGKEAVATSPVWTNTYNNVSGAYAAYQPEFVTNVADDTLSNLLPRDLYVRSSIFSGSDWGEGSGQAIFNTPGFTGGESRILIDGQDYNTTASAQGSDLPFMDIAHSIIGAGTSVEGGDIYTDIIIRNYGYYDCPTVSKELYSIQRADYVLVQNSNFKLNGAQDAYTSYPSPGYSFCRTDSLVFRGSNVMHIDVPALYMNSLTFLKANGEVAKELADKQAMYNRSNPTACDAVDMCSRLPNATATAGYTTLYISDGAYLNVQSAPSTNDNVQSAPSTDETGYDPTSISGGTYGPVNGYAFVVAEDHTQAFLTARNKVVGNNLHVNDGGLFSTCSTRNTQDVWTDGQGGGEHVYTNHTDTDGDYRTWGEGSGTRSRKITIVAHSDVSQLGNNYPLNYTEDTTATLAYATASLQLPPAPDGHYYVLEDLQVDAANGGQINLIGSAYNGEVWQQAIGVSEPATGKAIARDPNYTFGLLVKTGENFASQPSDTTATSAVITGTSLFTGNMAFRTVPVVGESNEIPELDFVLTYDPNFNLTLVRDVTFKLHEMTQNGQHSGNPIEVTVTISTILTEFENTEVDLLAMYNEGESNEFTNKVVLPATLQRRDLYLKNIKWDPVAIENVSNAFHITNVGAIPNVTNLFSIEMETSEDINFDLRGVSGWHSESVRWSDLHNLAGQAAETAPENVDVNLATDGSRGVLIGSLDGRNSAALDFTLHYNGNLIYPYEAYIGKVVLTFGWASGTIYDENDQFTVTVNVRTRVAADTIYMASANSVARGGVTLFPWNHEEPFVEDLTGKYPSVYLQNFNDVFDKKVFQIGDVIAIIDTIKVDGSNSESSSMFVNGTTYGNVKIIRYPGDHFEFPGEACAYRGPLFNVTDNAHFSAINLTFDGQGLSKKLDGYQSTQPGLGDRHGEKWHGRYGNSDSPYMSRSNPHTTISGPLYYYENQPSTPDTLAAYAPIFNVTGSGILTLNEGVTIQNNFNMQNPSNTTTHGGAVALSSSTTTTGTGDAAETTTNIPELEIANSVTIKNNMVAATKEGAGVYNNGGVIRLQESFDNSVIDIVDNYFAPAPLELPESTSETDNPFTYFVTPDNEDQPWFVYKMNNAYFDNLRENGDTDADKNVLSNVYLTRARNTANTLNSRVDVLTDVQSDMIYFDAQITSDSRIGISKWFPGNTLEAPRDTIRFANVSNNNQLFAQYAYNNGNFISDSVEYGVFWHPTISPFDLYLYRCLTFQKQRMGEVLWVNGERYDEDVQKSVLRYVHQGNRICPDGNDAILYSVNGGFYPYTFTWERDNQTIREYTTPYANNLVNADALKAIISNTDTFATDDLILPVGINNGTFNYTLTATDLFGCQQVKKIQVNVTKSLTENASFTYNDTAFVDFADMANVQEEHTEDIDLKYRAVAVEAAVQPDGFGSIDATIDGEQVEVDPHNGVAYCPGDVIDLVATPAEGKEFVMWDFDPFDNPSASFVVPAQDANINAYFSATDYWRQVVTSHSLTNGGYTTDYYGNVDIYNEEGLAWLISVVNGLNGQQIRPFFFDSIHIHAKADGTPYDMSDHKWTPVGTQHHRFRGRVKADDGVVIKGIILNEPGMPYVGMFGHVDSARFDGLDLQGVMAKGALYVGGLAANAVQTEIQNTSLSDNTGDVVSILTTSYVSGGLVGNADRTRVRGAQSDSPSDISRTEVKAKFIGTAVYSGGVIGYMVDSKIENTYAYNIDRMNALYHGGLAGYSHSTVTNNSSALQAKAGDQLGSSITNNYVHIVSDGTSQRVGGLVGYAQNTQMLNNYVYGEANGTSASGALAATLVSGNIVDHCYYQVDVNDEVVAADPYQSTSNISSFSGNGNQVLMTEYVDGVNNLTRVLNKWVRANNSDGKYLTWRSDLFGENNGYPLFGTPDMIPVYDTIRHATCDYYVWQGEELYESGNYSVSWSDTTEMVDTTLTLVLTINEAMTMELFDSVLVGESYNNYGFSVSATETELLRQTVEQEGFALIELSDTLTTVHGCDSIILLSLTVYNSDSTGDVNVITPVTIEVMVYPNPTVNVVNVEGTGLLSVEVYDNVSRRLRLIETQSDKCTFNLDGQPSGAYYLRIKTTSGTVIKKIIKK